MISQITHYGRNDDQGPFPYAQNFPSLFRGLLRSRPQIPPATIKPPAIIPRMTARFDGVAGAVAHTRPPGNRAARPRRLRASPFELPGPAATRGAGVRGNGIVCLIRSSENLRERRHPCLCSQGRFSLFQVVAARGARLVGKGSARMISSKLDRNGVNTSRPLSVTATS